jgi:hypothetical protein
MPKKAPCTIKQLPVTGGFFLQFARKSTLQNERVGFAHSPLKVHHPTNAL